MTKYLAFAFVDYEARGGWGDLIGEFIDLASAIEAVSQSYTAFDEAEIVEVNLDLEFNLILTGTNHPQRKNEQRLFTKRRWEWKEAMESET